MKIQLSHNLIDNIRRLLDGEQMPASKLKYGWVEDFVDSGLLIPIPHKTRLAYKIANKESFLSALPSIHPALKDLDKAAELVDNEGGMSRAEQVAAFGNSKAKKTKTAYGFMVNSLEPIETTLRGVTFIVQPPMGSYVFIADPKSFEIPEDVLVVGIENMENFYRIREQDQFVKKMIEKLIGTTDRKILFVSRYPQNVSLREWLMAHKNWYFHFGDYDLEGVRIFQSEFQKYIPERSYMLIPDDIEKYIEQYGSRELYDKHYSRCKNLNSKNEDIQNLLDCIHKHRKGCEQEVFINTY